MNRSEPTLQGAAYQRPQLRALGTLSGLTLGMNGSCPDGGSFNNNQLGGMSTCGQSEMSP
jgi:hypothetical protein